MAKTVNVVITDDLDGSPDAETVAFGLDGHSYEIDLGKKNRAKLEKSLQPFMDVARRTTQRRTARASRGSGSGLGSRAGPQGVRARPHQRRGDEQVRGCSLTASRAGKPQ